MKWITNQLPDEDITVLMRLDDLECPIWPGFRDDANEWRNADASRVEVQVLGWMHLDEASVALDYAHARTNEKTRAREFLAKARSEASAKRGQTNPEQANAFPLPPGEGQGEGPPHV